MPLYRTTPSGFERLDGASIKLEALIVPSYDVTLPAQKGFSAYAKAYVVPPKPAYPQKSRGPRLRTRCRRPSRYPRRYRVCVYRIPHG